MCNSYVLLKLLWRALKWHTIIDSGYFWGESARISGCWGLANAFICNWNTKVKKCVLLKFFEKRKCFLSTVKIIPLVIILVQDFHDLTRESHPEWEGQDTLECKSILCSTLGLFQATFAISFPHWIPALPAARPAWQQEACVLEAILLAHWGEEGLRKLQPNIHGKVRGKRAIKKTKKE